MLQITKVGGLLLTRVESNVKEGSSCSAAFVYCHGFPDASVTPDALEESGRQPQLQPEHGFWASRFPRKLCEHVLAKFSDVAFLAFNSRGIPGSGDGAPHARVEDPPPEFEAKTLTGDMEDIASVVQFAAEQLPGAKLFLCGMSTGAFLSLAFVARPDLHPLGGVAGCFVLACVADIPSSAALDFSPEQLESFADKGYCLKEFFPFGGAENPQYWRLGRAYLDSYAAFPDARALGASLCVPVLLLHGEDDRHVPPEHGDALHGALQPARGAAVELVRVRKGNHFLSANGALRAALAAVSAFLVRAGLAPL